MPARNLPCGLPRNSFLCLLLPSAAFSSPSCGRFSQPASGDGYVYTDGSAMFFGRFSDRIYFDVQLNNLQYAFIL